MVETGKELSRTLPSETINNRPVIPPRSGTEFDTPKTIDTPEPVQEAVRASLRSLNKGLTVPEGGDKPRVI